MPQKGYKSVTIREDIFEALARMAEGSNRSIASVVETLARAPWARAYLGGQNVTHPVEDKPGAASKPGGDCQGAGADGLDHGTEEGE